jgi:hypothetical protein
MPIVFEFDGDVAEQIAGYLGDLRDKTPAVIAQAANSTARKARKLIVAGIKKKYTSDAKTKEYNSAMHVYTASAKKPVATVSIKGPTQSLHRFKVDPSEPAGAGERPSGTRAQVLTAGGSMKLLEKGGIKAFVTAFNSGDVAVVQRTGKTYSYLEHTTRTKGKVYEHRDDRHDRIRKLWSLSVPKMAGTELNIGMTMRDDVQELLQQELAKQIEKTLRKAGRI